MSVIIKAVPSYEKCFFDESLDTKQTLESASCLRGEEFHFEVVFTTEDSPAWLLGEVVTLAVKSPLAEEITFERVEQVPVRFPCYPLRSDEDYLRKTPGLYPDLLVPVCPGDPVEVPFRALASLYVTVCVPETLAPGDYDITVALVSENGTEYEASLVLSVLDAVLPCGKLIYTEWFHVDCIADAYGIEIFSETHWKYIESYMRCAVKNGVNAILTPVFTPPLDTAEGGERPTVQLVDVMRDSAGWHFSFERLHRWISLCLRCGIEYFEISHLFTQWGAAHAPKIVGIADGKKQKLFGWETDSLSDEYIRFLRAFLTAFLSEMKKLGLDRKCIFHISDEPGMAHLERYRALKNSISDLLCGYRIVDTLSDFDFYQTGAVDMPIPASDRIEPFLAAGIENLWTYYCCAQGREVSNRFLAMPASRTRIIGAQLWKYRIEGFLHWGYNFWYTRFSKRKIDPYVILDGGCFAPAGDCFSVYPGPGGMPYQSLHMKAFTEALTDLRAMYLAESLCGREAVLRAVEKEGEITFSRYPRETNTAFALRSRINDLIRHAVKNKD